MKRSFLVFILSIFLISCGYYSEYKYALTKSIATPEINFSLTQTSIIETHPTAQMIIENVWQCQSFSELSDYKSALILESTNHTNNIFIFYTTDFKLEHMPESIRHSSIHASTTKEWLAYTSYIENVPERKFIIARSFQTDEIISTEVQPSLFDIEGAWINEHQLILQKSGTPYDKIILFDPFTGEQKEMNETYPEMNSEDRGWDMIGPGLKIYDPTLSRVVYFALNRRFIYWDIIKNQKINEFAGDIATVPPEWSPNGKSFIFIDSTNDDYINRVYKNEIKLVDWVGSEQQLTNFSGYYSYEITGPLQWSPDSNYLAFYIDIQSYENSDYVSMLAIVDVQTKQTRLYSCISPAYSLTWSPDSKYLATNDVRNGFYTTYILRLSDDALMKVGDDLTPLEWVK